MSISDAQFTAWLSDPAAIRCVLFEVGVRSAGAEITRYLSTTGYTTGASETPASTTYEGIATGGMSLTESISLDGEASLSIGDIKVSNHAGERDSWLSDIWTNRSAVAYVGDVRWPRADFRLIFSGVVADIGSENRSTLNIILANKLQRLNTAMTELKWGGECEYSQVGSTVTVTKPSHNRAVGSTVTIKAITGSGISLEEGDFVIATVPDVDTFTYTSAMSTTESGVLRISGVNSDQIIPITLGETHNITPLLIDPVNLRYQVHQGAVHDIFEVRDNGIPVAVTKDNGKGIFTLGASPAGAVTATVQGDKAAAGYINTPGALVQRIVTGYGVTVSQFTVADLDTASLTAFDMAYARPCGVFINDRSNVLATCQQVAGSVGAQPVVTRAGLLRLIQLTFPPTGTPTEIPRSAQIDRTLQVVARSTVRAAVKLNYVKNWTLQPGLQTTIPAEHKEMFATEWWTVTAKDADVAALYRLTTDPVAEDTYLLTREDAQAEAERRLLNVKEPRTTYRFEGTAAHMELELGETVRLYSNRFGLDAGEVGIVTSLTPNWQDCHVTVEVTI